MSNLTKRTLSGIVFVLVFVSCILIGRSTYFCLFLVVTALAMDEYNRLINTAFLWICLSALLLGCIMSITTIIKYRRVK